MCTQTVLTTHLCNKCDSPMSNSGSPCCGIGHMSREFSWRLQCIQNQADQCSIGDCVKGSKCYNCESTGGVSLRLVFT
ncbi:hypothetical protein QBC32DRAFT_357871 [Pseudoneurospora amorphoporcata]|uniref:Uncharacterized protein n=1 Tax=Pseudoneurospora amorphoporcata TaxID=241081 RepID=A0AAN6NJY7_9PEZI|nr:hypothetical protein QBC32DRAFT_357871 [Pseudoneurospora amorphoporcata]